jgi:Zn-dependent protease with chaperone function
MAKTLLLIPLLAYGTFELTTLAFERFFPKLIILIVLGGLIALWRSISTLLKSVPMEFSAPMARAVTPAEAPRLWDEIRAAALRVGTAPPDHVMLGMENNFYVTELAVNYQGGRTAGRTLYLSLPLMQQLTAGEVLAIIGHELGHFRGDDTAITREFYPLRFKAGATLHAMAEAGWVGWASLHSLLFFHGSFARTEQTMSRERELVADKVAADLTSPAVMGSALTKIHVFAEAFLRTLRGGAANPFTVPLAGYVRDQLVHETDFWRELFEQKSPHPLDSHPALRVRLQALGQPVDPEFAKVVATTAGDSAHAQWLAGRDELFTGIQAEALEAIGRVRATTADYATAEGKQLLDQHFPEIRWKTRPSALWLRLIGCGLGVAISLVVLFAIDGAELKLMMLGFALICGWPMVVQWRRHHRGEFVLRADGISYTGWKRMLPFAEVANVTGRSEYGSITLTFYLQALRPGIWRYSPFGWISTRTVSLALGLIPGKQEVTAETIVRYLSRQPGP